MSTRTTIDLACPTETSAFLFSIDSMSLVDSSKARPKKLQYQPSSIDSLGARVIQYKYAIVKLTLFVAALDRILADTQKSRSSSNQVFLVHYMCFCVATMFSVNESGFASKLTALALFKVPRPSSVSISGTVAHAPYDGKDYPLTSLTDLPLAGTSFLCLKALKSMCQNCLEGYRKRYKNASREIENPALTDDLNYLLENELFASRTDLDLSLVSLSLPVAPLVLNVDTEHLNDGGYTETCLIDMDISALFVFVYNVSSSLVDLSGPLESVRTVKSAPKPSQSALFNALPDSAYTLHKLLFWSIRLNDLYLIFRRFVRQIYHSNLRHLSDSKFLAFVPNATIFRSQLAELNKISTTAKKNGILVATITRFIRTNSKHEVSSRSCSDFVGFVSQFLECFESMVSLLKSFGCLWLSGEIAFRLERHLYTDTLLELQRAFRGKPKTELEIKKERDAVLREKGKQEVLINRRHLSMLCKGKQKVSTLPQKQEPVQELGPKTKTKYTPNGTGKSDKESYILALSSSILITEDFPRAPNFSKGSLGIILSNHQTSSVSSLSAPRTVSLSSLSALPKANDASTNVGNRARSSSQPLSYAKADKGRDTFLNHLVLPKPSVKTPEDNSDKDKGLSRKLSANQKFQQHMKEASKSGAFLSKEKEVFTSVVFDPSNPSGVNLRRVSKVHTNVVGGVNFSHNSTSSSSYSASVSTALSNTKMTKAPQMLLSSSAAAMASRARLQEDSEKASKPSVLQQPKPAEQKAALSYQQKSTALLNANSTASTKVTRAQITKRNTHRNSVLARVQKRDQQAPNANSIDSSSAPTVSDLSLSSPSKKVRFTGVPDWTPVEDAPAGHSKRALKNFTSLRFAPFSHSAFKQKDKMLKTEESLSFKQHLNPSESAASQTLAASYKLRFANFQES